MPWNRQGKICVETFSCGVPRCNLVRPTSPSDPAYHGLSSPRSKLLPAISKSPRWRSLRLRSTALSSNFCVRVPWEPLVTLKSRNDPRHHAPNSSKGKTSGQRSKMSKPQKKAPPPRPWTDRYHPAAAKEVVQLSSTVDRKQSVKNAIAEPRHPLVRTGASRG